MSQAKDGTYLPCGADLGLLVDQVAETLPPGDSEHQASCEYCRAALAELEPLWGQIRQLAREDVVVPAALVATVMRVVREERSPRAPKLALRDVIPRLIDHALLLGDRGTLKIADSVIAQVIARETLATPGVSEFGAVEVVVDESQVSARLRLVIELGWSIPDVLLIVRLRAGTELQRITGLEAVAIDITVTDVQDRYG